MKIEHRADEGLVAFVIGEDEFVFPRKGEEDDWLRLELAQCLKERAVEIELFFGPQDKVWTIMDLVGSVFGESVDQDEAISLVANLVSWVAWSAVMIEGPLLIQGVLEARVIEELRLRWFRWCLDVLKQFSEINSSVWMPRLLPDKEEVVVGKLLTACQLTFNEWIPIGDQRFKYTTPPTKVN